MSYNDANLNETLLLIFKLVGLTPDRYPTGLDSMLLNNSIISTFGNLTVQELRIAFDLAIKKEYEVELNHYGTFSALYFSNIVNAYIEHRKKVVKELNKERAKLEAAPKELTPEQIEEANKKFDFLFIYKPFMKYYHTGEMDFAHASINQVFRRLEEDLKLIVMSDDEKKELFDKEKERILLNVQRDMVMTSNSKIKEQLKTVMKGSDKVIRKMYIQEQCRRIVLKNFFETHKNQKTDMIKLLELTKYVTPKKK